VQPPSGFTQLGDGMCLDIDGDVGDWASDWKFDLSIEECADNCLSSGNCAAFSFSEANGYQISYCALHVGYSIATQTSAAYNTGGYNYKCYVPADSASTKKEICWNEMNIYGEKCSESDKIASVESEQDFFQCLKTATLLKATHIFFKQIKRQGINYCHIYRECNLPRQIVRSKGVSWAVGPCSANSQKTTVNVHELLKHYENDIEILTQEKDLCKNRLNWINRTELAREKELLIDGAFEAFPDPATRAEVAVANTAHTIEINLSWTFSDVMERIVIFLLGVGITVCIIGMKNNKSDNQYTYLLEA